MTKVPSMTQKDVINIIRDMHKEEVTSNQIIQHAKTIANSPSESTIRKQLQSLVKNKILKHNIAERTYSFA
ncbi:MAG: hypothetical protein ACPKQO_06395 [Nitrososphaeraceae archaeon]